MKIFGVMPPGGNFSRIMKSLAKTEIHEDFKTVYANRSTKLLEVVKEFKNKKTK